LRNRPEMTRLLAKDHRTDPGPFHHGRSRSLPRGVLPPAGGIQGGANCRLARGDRRPGRARRDRRPGRARRDRRPGRARGDRRPGRALGDRRPGRARRDRRSGLARGDRRPGLARGDRRPGLALGDRRPGLALGDRRSGLARGDRRSGLARGDRRPRPARAPPPPESPPKGGSRLCSNLGNAQLKSRGRTRNSNQRGSRVCSTPLPAETELVVTKTPPSKPCPPFARVGKNAARGFRTWRSAQSEESAGSWGGSSPPICRTASKTAIATALARFRLRASGRIGIRSAWSALSLNQ